MNKERNERKGIEAILQPNKVLDGPIGRYSITSRANLCAVMPYLPESWSESHFHCMRNNELQWKLIRPEVLEFTYTAAEHHWIRIRINARLWVSAENIISDKNFKHEKPDTFSLDHSTCT